MNSFRIIALVLSWWLGISLWLVSQSGHNHFVGLTWIVNFELTNKKITIITMNFQWGWSYNDHGLMEKFWITIELLKSFNEFHHRNYCIMNGRFFFILIEFFSLHSLFFEHFNKTKGILSWVLNYHGELISNERVRERKRRKALKHFPFEWILQFFLASLYILFAIRKI